VLVTFAEGVCNDVASLIASPAASDESEVELLKHRIAELLVECKGEPLHR
jgi:hypothetical protein